jgi:hypothetical protein
VDTTFSPEGVRLHVMPCARRSRGAASIGTPVDEEITIRILNCGCAGASPGEIVLDEEVLTDPRFGLRYAWGIVQHEYAHQVAFFLVDARARRRVQRWLGGGDWCYEGESAADDDHACERFASSLTWAYWPR